MAFAASACASPTGGEYPSNQENAVAGQIMQKLNAERAGRGLPPLVYNAQLAVLAYHWSQHLDQTNTFQHRNLSSLFSDPAYTNWGSLGENIFWGSDHNFTSGDIELAWMNSDGHRENMLNPGFDSVGIGVYCAADGRVYATENYGRQMNSGLPGLATSPPPLNPIVSPSRDGASCNG
jgi:uncharacterized protein YkwD